LDIGKIQHLFAGISHTPKRADQEAPRGSIAWNGVLAGLVPRPVLTRSGGVTVREIR
jgi:hypothetical protein